MENDHVNAHHSHASSQLLSGRFEGLANTVDTALQEASSWSKALRSNLGMWRDEIEAGRMLVPRVTEERGGAPKLGLDVLEDFFEVTREALDDDAWTSLWESFEAFRRSVGAAAFRTAIEAKGDTMAGEIAEEMATLTGNDESGPLSAGKIEKAVAGMLTAWLEASGGRSELEQQMAFIEAFFGTLVKHLEADSEFWQILLERLRLYGRREAPEPDGSTWDAPIDALVASPTIVMAGHAYYDAVARDESASGSGWVDWLPTLAVLRANNNALGRRFFGTITLAFFPEEADGLLKADAAWIGTLRREMERSSLDPLEAERKWLVGARDSWDTASRMIADQAGARKKTAEEMAQGLKGANAAKDIQTGLDYLLGRALWLVTVEPRLPRARMRFLYDVVAVGGVNLKEDAWRKLSQMVVSLQNGLKAEAPSPTAKSAISLLEALSKRGEEWRHIEVFALRAVAESDSAWQGERDATLKAAVVATLDRLMIEARLVGPAAAANATIRWFADSRAIFNDAAVLEGLVRLVGHFADTVRQDENSSITAQKLIGELAADLPRLYAAENLRRNAASIAEETAGHVFHRIPDYAEKVGEKGYASCIRDNQLTLEQAGEALLANQEEAGEVLLDWWSSVVGTYLANRPDDLFEANLQGIYNGIASRLPNRETGVAFAPIAHVYRESLGVECMDAKASLPLHPEGTLWNAAIGKRLSAYQNLMGVSREELEASAEVASARIFDQLEPEFYRHLLDLLESYLAEYAARGDAEQAARPYYPRWLDSIEAHGAERIAGFYAIIARDLRGKNVIPSIPLEEPVRALNLQLGNLGLGRKLQASAEAIASDFPRVLRHAAPELYTPETAAELEAKCTRDQTLLWERQGYLLTAEPASVYWLHGPLYLMEMILPHVDYSGEIWALAVRHAAFSISDEVDLLESSALFRWLNQWHALADSFGGLCGWSRKYFRLGDYSFSADGVEEARMRRTLAACIIRSITPDHAPVSGSSVLKRYLLSLDEPLEKLSEDFEKSIQQLRGMVGENVPEPLDGALQEAVDAVQRAVGAVAMPGELSPHAMVYRLLETPHMRHTLWASIALASNSSEETFALCRRECELFEADGIPCVQAESSAYVFELWQKWADLTKERALEEADKAVAEEILLAHLLLPFDFCAGVDHESFSHGLVARVGERLLVGRVKGEASVNPLKAVELIAELKDNASLQRACRAAKAVLPRVATALQVAKENPRESTEPMEDDEPGAVFPRPAKWQPFIVQALLAPSICPTSWLARGQPVRRVFEIFSRNLSPRRTIPLTEVFLGFSRGLRDRRGPVWQRLAEGGGDKGALAVSTEEQVTAMVQAVGKALSKDAQGSADKVTERLSVAVDCFVSALRQTGDMETAVEALKAALVDDLDLLGSEALVGAYVRMRSYAAETFDPALVPFWYSLLEWAEEAARDVSFGAAVFKASALRSEKPADGENGAGDAENKAVVLLRLLGTVNQTLSRSQGVLVLGRWLLESGWLTDVAQVSELQKDLCSLENRWAETMDPAQKATFWEWTGLLQELVGRLSALAPVRHAALAARPKAVSPFIRPQEESVLFSGLLVAGAAPQAGTAHSDAVLGRVACESPLFQRSGEATGRAFDRNNQAWSESGLAFPLPVRQILQRWHELISFTDVLVAKQGQPLSRFCGIQTDAPGGRRFWRTALLAETAAQESPSDPLDLLLAEQFNEEIPQPDTARSLKRDLEWLRKQAPSLDVPQTKKPAGLLKKIFSNSTQLSEMERAEVKNEALVFLSEATVGNFSEEIGRAFGRRCLFHPRLMKIREAVKNPSILDFYGDLSALIANTFGEAYPISVRVKKIHSVLERMFRAWRMLEGDVSERPECWFFALAELDLKHPMTAVVYGGESTDDPVLAISAMRKRFQETPPEFLDETALKSTRRAWDALAENVSE